MAGGKFIGWLLDGVPTLFDWFKKRGKINYAQKIDKAVDNDDTRVISDELRKLADKVEKRKQSS